MPVNYIQNVTEPATGESAQVPFDMNLQRLASDPTYQAYVVNMLANNVLLPKEVKEKDFPVEKLFAAAQPPPAPIRAGAPGAGAGASVGRAAIPQQLLQAPPPSPGPAGHQTPSLGALIRGGR